MYDGGERTTPRVTSAEPSPTALPWTEGFASRVAVQGVGMLGVAVLVMALVDDRAAETEARLADLESRLELVRLERDRMQRLSHELAVELDDAAMEAEIVRWQLAYTEERFARLEAEEEALASPRPPSGWSAGPPATFASLDPVDGRSPDAPSSDALQLPLAAPVAIVATATLDSLTDASGFPASVGSGSAVPEQVGVAPSPARWLQLEGGRDADTLEPLRPVGSQLERDRAFAAWTDLLEEAASGECGGRGVVAERRCRDAVRRELWPSGSRAVDCILSGNAAPDYVDDIRLDQLPTHSKPLEKGAVIFCDGGLRNL